MLDMEKGKHLLDEITFQVLKLEKVSQEIKEIENLGEIKASIEKLKNVKIDTSRFENEMELEFKKIKNKIAALSDSFDLSELDEISLKLKQIQKSTKPYRAVSLILVALSCLCLGYVLNIFRPILPQSLEMQKFEIFKEQGVELKETQDYRYILVPASLEIRKLKNGENAVLIKK